MPPYIYQGGSNQLNIMIGAIETTGRLLDITLADFLQ